MKPIFQAIAAGSPTVPRAAIGSVPRGRPFGQDGAQRHRITATCSSSAKRTTCCASARHGAGHPPRRLRPMEQGPARQLPDRDHPDDPGLRRSRDPGNRWSISSSMRPVRRAPASGRSSRPADLGVPLTLIGEAVSLVACRRQKDERVAASRSLEGSGRSTATARKTSTSTPSARPVRQQDHWYAPRLRASSTPCATSPIGKSTRATSPACGVAECVARRRRSSGKIKEAFGPVTPISRTSCSIGYFHRRQLDRSASMAGATRPSPRSVSAFQPGDELPRSLTRRLPLRDLLPANLLQAQRDYFGAHTLRDAVDQPRGRFPYRLDRTRRLDRIV